MQPDPRGVRAVARCSCGNDKFILKIYACGYERAHCTDCGEAWESPFRGAAQDASSDQTVGEVRDESSDLVSPPEGEKRTPESQMMVNLKYLEEAMEESRDWAMKSLKDKKGRR